MVLAGVLRDRRTKASAADTTHLRESVKGIAVVREKGFAVVKEGVVKGLQSDALGALCVIRQERERGVGAVNLKRSSLKFGCKCGDEEVPQ